MIKKALKKHIRVWMTLIHFCRYQLMVVASQLLLMGNKSVVTFLMLALKLIVACESISMSHNKCLGRFKHGDKRAKIESYRMFCNLFRRF
jgi:hypothetical protein